jgi:hypothetical protein
MFGILLWVAGTKDGALKANGCYGRRFTFEPVDAEYAECAAMDIGGVDRCERGLRKKRASMESTGGNSTTG